MRRVLPDPAFFRSVSEADVYKCGRLAGRLRREMDDVVFTYDAAYRDDAESPPVAFALPKDGREVRATGGSVPAFFAGMLPEGLRLSAVSTAARTSQDDHLTLLLAVGGDTIGDVQVVPAGITLADPPQVLAEEDAGKADFQEVFAKATAADADALDRVALPGVQVKVSAQMISTPLTTSPGPAIFKLNPPQDPFLVENENFFLTMAASCGIAVPDHRLIHDRHGRGGLIIARFDRVEAAGQVRRLAQEDACQVLNRYPSAKYLLKLEDVIKGLAGAVEGANGSRPLAVRRALEVAVFSYLIGNGDLHGKNLSVRQNPDGVWEMTPAYDLVSTEPYLGWRDPMALRLYGRDNKLGRRWWLEAAERLGLGRKSMAEALTRITESAAPWLDRIDEIGFAEPTTRRLADLIAHRHRELGTAA